MLAMGRSCLPRRPSVLVSGFLDRPVDVDLRQDDLFGLVQRGQQVHLGAGRAATAQRLAVDCDHPLARPGQAAWPSSQRHTAASRASASMPVSIRDKVLSSAPAGHR